MASGIPNVIVAVSRCSSRTDFLYGMRIEQISGSVWEVDWAFPIPAAAAAREGYDRNTASGTIQLSDDYPGCPNCSSPGFVLCGNCKRLGCWDGKGGRWTCPWCRQTGDLGGEINSLSGGGDA